MGMLMGFASHRYTNGYEYYVGMCIIYIICSKLGCVPLN